MMPSTTTILGAENLLTVKVAFSKSLDLGFDYDENAWEFQVPYDADSTALCEGVEDLFGSICPHKQLRLDVHMLSNPHRVDDDRNIVPGKPVSTYYNDLTTYDPLILVDGEVVVDPLVAFQRRDDGSWIS